MKKLIIILGLLGFIKTQAQTGALFSHQQIINDTLQVTGKANQKEIAQIARKALDDSTFFGGGSGGSLMATQVGYGSLSNTLTGNASYFYSYGIGQTNNFRVGFPGGFGGDTSGCYISLVGNNPAGDGIYIYNAGGIILQGGIGNGNNLLQLGTGYGGLVATFINSPSIHSAVFNATAIQFSAYTAGLAKFDGSGNISSVTDVAFLDVHQSYSKGQAVTPVALTFSTTVAWDMSGSNNFVLPMTNNANFAVPSNPLAGQTGWIDVYQDGTGSRTLFGSPAWCYTAAGGTFPTLTTTALARDKLTYVVDYYETASVTCTSANPGVVTYTAHGMQSGDRFAFTSGTPPTGTSLNTLYFITVIDANTFNLSSSYANFQIGKFLTTSSTGSTLIGTFLSVTIGTSCLNCQ